jgi:uncharacterized membrane protein YccC
VWLQASSIALAVIILQSSFDYPLRTPALLALGAAFCGTLGRRSGSLDDATTTKNPRAS